MKKRITVGVICFSLIVAYMAPASFAGTEPNPSSDLNSGQDIVNVLHEVSVESGNISNQEREYVINSATPDAIEEYNAIVKDEVEEFLEEQNFSLPVGKDYYEETVNLDCGAKIEMKLEDQKEEGMLQAFFGKISDIFIAEANAESSSLWKDYGDRYFTATMIIYGQGKITWTFENHYTIGSEGISLRKGVGRASGNGFIRNLETWHVREDSTATAIGHDVHYKATVQWNEATIADMIGLDYLIGPFERNMRSLVKIVQWDKANQKMYITQSYDKI